MRAVTRAAGRVWVGSATLVAVAAAVVIAAAVLGPAGVVAEWEAVGALDLVPVALGWLVLRGAPTSPVGPALAWMGTATVTVRAVEVWGLTAAGPGPWWGSHVAAFVGPGVWPWQLMGFFALVLLFPKGLAPGRVWLAVAVLGPAAALMINIALAGSDPRAQEMPAGWRTPMLLVGLLLLLVALGGAVACLVVRFRRGDELTRLQLRWVLLAAASVPVLLAVSWVVVDLGVPGPIAYGGFLIGILVLVPAAVTLAVLRHDLLDIEQLISSTVAVLLTAVASAGLFATVVWVLGSGLAGPSGLGATAASFVTALCLLPLYHRLHGVVSRVTDRERTVMLAAVREFVEQVRDGAAAPEQVEDVLRVAIADPGARLTLVVPGTPGHVDLRGEPAPIATGTEHVSLRTHDAEVGVLVLTRASSRRRRLATEAARAARLPIEVSRLRLELRAALEDVTASRSRLVAAVVDERRRLEQDLHDGAQQSVLAIGMRLQSLRHRLTDPLLQAEVDSAVRAVADSVVELRRIAHGVRPRRLDDGLAAALHELASDSPVPLDVVVADLPPDDMLVTTAYLVAAEAVANAWKHARAQRVAVTVQRCGGRTRVEITDDGIGGVGPAASLTALHDRVASVGGELDVVSPVGGGTRVTAVI